MRIFTNFTFYTALSLIMLITYSITFSQQSNNNAFVFNGESSRVFIEDGLAVNQELKLPLEGNTSVTCSHTGAVYRLNNTTLLRISE